MSYYTRLHPWCIVRLLPNLQRVTVARFRCRNDADAHVRTLRRLVPEAIFVILFDVAVAAPEVGGCRLSRSRIGGGGQEVGSPCDLASDESL